MTFTATTLEAGDDLTGLTVAVYGLGKMGLPLAAVLADHGADVRGVDVDEDTVETVNDGRTPVSEPGLSSLVGSYGGSRLTATTDGSKAATEADVMVVLVPTIVDEEYDPLLDPVLDVAAAIEDGISEGDLAILESTVPPGTTVDLFAEAAEPPELEAGTDFGVAHCPERTSSGRVIEDLTGSYPKIVGGTTERGTAAAASLYRTFNEPGVIELPGATAAEAVKVFEGVYRDVNIALANELAMACEEWGLDATRIFDAANSQPYCNLHDPGIGVGGHCIPVYPHFVIDRADETCLVEKARRTNLEMPRHTVDVTTSLLRGEGVDPVDASVLVLGLTYRPGVEETRFAPALDVVESLAEIGASVFAHDPLLSATRIEETGATPVSDPVGSEDRFDAAILATGHETYRDLDLGALRNRMRTPILVDGRDFFEDEATDSFTYACLGDGTTAV